VREKLLTAVFLEIAIKKKKIKIFVSSVVKIIRENPCQSVVYFSVDSAVKNLCVLVF